MPQQPPGPPAGTPSAPGEPGVARRSPSGVTGRLWDLAKARVPELAAVEDVQKEYLSQLNKNSFYTSTGATQRGAFADRFREELAAFSHPLTFNSREARQAFKTATEMGYNADTATSRSDVVGFWAGNKRAFGASPQESARLTQMMQQTGNDSAAQLT